ncbi:Metallo-dependent phosphatase-like protein [Multifurca ochricompacta]|uniref:Metallo-dependent phosphatase-like protein n=1 Tax=Multifurca ochricompacta TaxID=376703 RepID=A0AAD4M5E2_9AGAM|nr:Metallo-dependent phosphatase-like protein [Multifurca ochricompacta]
MRSLAAVAAVLAISARLAGACTDGEHHFQTPLVKPSSTQTIPHRKLVWGDVNIIHTTDTHGWLLGHQKLVPPEPNYNGNFGDFASFVNRIKATADAQKRDFLLVDTGDLHDGTGLSDGYPRGLEFDGEETDKFFSRLPYDIMTIGNHELYYPEVALDMHVNFTKMTKRYLTSNAFINITSETGLTKTVPIGWQVAKFQTSNHRLNVTAFGIVFNTTGAPNVRVEHAKVMVNQPWFQDAINERPDFFLLTGHMSVSGDKRVDNWKDVIDPIRAKHHDTPIIILAGHTHTRNCTQYNDKRVVALESGSYMDTVGWLSFNLPKPGNDLDYNRRYLDPNRVTYEFHTNTTEKTFDTDEGKKLTEDLGNLYNKFELYRLWGKSPQDYSLFYQNVTSDKSVLNLFINKVLPRLFSNVPCGGKSNPKFFLINSGVLRYDIFNGEFNQNDQLTASSYQDKLWCIPDVQLQYASATANKMNGHASGNSLEHSFFDPREARRHEMAEVDAIRQRWIAEMSKRANFESLQVEDKTLGYVTQDTCGNGQPGDGDDTEHISVGKQVTFPKMLASWQSQPTNATLMDIVILDHGWQALIGTLNSVQSRKYGWDDIVKNFTNLTTDAVLGEYALKEWNTTSTNAI